MQYSSTKILIRKSIIQKYLKLSRLIPEAIALTIVLLEAHTVELSTICWLLLIYSLILRLVWNSAIIVHGLGHSLAIALADRQLSAINLTNVLEHRSIANILKSLFPFNYIFIFVLSPYLKPGKPEHIRLKAIGGMLGNLAIAIIFFFSSHNIFGQALITANLLIAFSSLSDIDAFITGVADYLYCGNFGLIALRKVGDGQKLLPERMVDIAQQMGQETEIRGEQAGGGLVMGSQGDLTMFADRKVLFVGKKIVNRKRRNLTTSLEAAFAPIREEAISAGVKPLKSTVMGVWHYRYATSGTAPSELETHWHEWMGARNYPC